MSKQGRSGFVVGILGVFSLLILFLVIGTIVAVLSTRNAETDTEENVIPDNIPAPVVEETVPTEDDRQQKLEVLIQNMINQGVFVKTSHQVHALPEIYVNADFQQLDENTQNKFLLIVYEYYEIKVDGFGRNQSSASPLVIKVDNDAASGSVLGKYEPHTGVRWQ